MDRSAGPLSFSARTSAAAVDAAQAPTGDPQDVPAFASAPSAGVDPTEPATTRATQAPPGREWVFKGRNFYFDRFGTENAPTRAIYCSAEGGKTGKGLWQHRETVTGFHRVKGIQTVRGMNYRIAMTVGKVTGGSGAVSLGAKGVVKQIPIAGAVTVSTSKSTQVTLTRGLTVDSSTRRRIIELPVVYERYLWRLGCDPNEDLDGYRRNYEFQELVPARTKGPLHVDVTTSLPLQTCGRGKAGPADIQRSQGGNTKPDVGRSTTTTQMKDVSGEVSVLGQSLKVGLNTANTSSIEERATLLDTKPFKVCTWKQYGPGPRGEPAWEVHGEGTWIWTR